LVHKKTGHYIIGVNAPLTWATHVRKNSMHSTIQEEKETDRKWNSKRKQKKQNISHIKNI